MAWIFDMDPRTARRPGACDRNAASTLAGPSAIDPDVPSRDRRRDSRSDARKAAVRRRDAVPRAALRAALRAASREEPPVVAAPSAARFGRARSEASGTRAARHEIGASGTPDDLRRAGCPARGVLD